MAEVENAVVVNVTTGSRDVLIRALHDLTRAMESTHRALLAGEGGYTDDMRGKLSLAAHDAGNAHATLVAVRASLPSPSRPMNAAEYRAGKKGE